MNDRENEMKKVSQALKKAQKKYQTKRSKDYKIHMMYLNNDQAEIAQQAFKMFSTKKEAVIAGLSKIIEDVK